MPGFRSCPWSKNNMAETWFVMAQDVGCRQWITVSNSAGSGGIVCYSPDPADEPFSYEEWQQRKHLIVAAPKLLAALAGILEIGKRDMSNPKYDGYFDDARAAIAEATKES